MIKLRSRCMREKHVMPFGVPRAGPICFLLATVETTFCICLETVGQVSERLVECNPVLHAVAELGEAEVCISCEIISAYSPAPTSLP